MSSDKPVINLFTPSVVDFVWEIDMDRVRKGRSFINDEDETRVSNIYKQDTLVDFVNAGVSGSYYPGIETHSRFHTSQKFRTDYDTTRRGTVYIRQPIRSDNTYYPDARIYFSETADGPPMQWNGKDILPTNWKGRYCTLKWGITEEDSIAPRAYTYPLKPGTDYFLHFENYDRFDTTTDRRTVDYKRFFYLTSGSVNEVDEDGNDIIPGESPPPPQEPDIVRDYDISDLQWQSSNNLIWGGSGDNDLPNDPNSQISQTGIYIPANGKILSTKFKATGGVGKERLFEHKSEQNFGSFQDPDTLREEWISLTPGGEAISNSCMLNYGSSPGEDFVSGLSNFAIKQQTPGQREDENSCGIEVGKDYYFNMRHINPATPRTEYRRVVMQVANAPDDVFIEDDISPEQWVANASSVPLSKTIKKNKVMVSSVNTDDDGSRAGLIEYATSAGGALVSLVSWFSLTPGGNPISDIGLTTVGNSQSFQWTQEPLETERPGYVRLERNQQYYLNTKHEDPEQEESVITQTTKTQESTYDEQFMGPGEWTGPITGEPPEPPPPPPPPTGNPDWWNPAPIESFDDLVPDVVNTSALNEYVSNFHESIGIDALDDAHAQRVKSYFRDTLSNVGRYSYRDFERFGNLIAQDIASESGPRQDGWVSLTQEVPHINHLTYGTGILYIHGEMEIPPYETSPGKQIKGTDFAAVGNFFPALQYIRSPTISWGAAGSTAPEGAQNLYFKQDSVAAVSEYPWKLGYVWDFEADPNGPQAAGTNGNGNYWYYNTILNEVGGVAPIGPEPNNTEATGYNDGSLYLVDNERNNFPWVIVNSGAPGSVRDLLNNWEGDTGMYDTEFPSYCQDTFPPKLSNGVGYKSGNSIKYILDFISPLKLED